MRPSSRSPLWSFVVGAQARFGAPFRNPACVARLPLMLEDRSRIETDIKEANRISISLLGRTVSLLLDFGRGWITISATRAIDLFAFVDCLLFQYKEPKSTDAGVILYGTAGSRDGSMAFFGSAIGNCNRKANRAVGKTISSEAVESANVGGLLIWIESICSELITGRLYGICVCDVGPSPLLTMQKMVCAIPVSTRDSTWFCTPFGLIAALGALADRPDQQIERRDCRSVSKREETL